VAARQQTGRHAVPAPTRLPAPDEAIAILVQAIQHPEANPQELCHHLQALYPHLSPVTIEALLPSMA